jgi:hypothetical protein
MWRRRPGRPAEKLSRRAPSRGGNGNRSRRRATRMNMIHGAIGRLVGDGLLGAPAGHNERRALWLCLFGTRHSLLEKSSPFRRYRLARELARAWLPARRASARRAGLLSGAEKNCLTLSKPPWHSTRPASLLGEKADLPGCGTAGIHSPCCSRTREHSQGSSCMGGDQPRKKIGFWTATWRRIVATESIGRSTSYALMATSACGLSRPPSRRSRLFRRLRLSKFSG